MQCREFLISGVDQPVVVFHNPDWSGIAIIEWWNGRNTERVKLPACILLHLSFEQTKQFVLNELTHALKQRLDAVDYYDIKLTKKGDRRGNRSR